MKLKLLLFSISFILISESKADLLLGMDIKGDTMAIAFKKTIRLIMISKDSTLNEFILVNDTAITGSIYRKSAQFNRVEEKNRADLRNSINDFSIVNLTWHENHLYAGFRFYIGKFRESKIQFGVIKLDEKMKMEGFCLIRNPTSTAVITIPPYFPLELKGKHELIMPYFDSAYISIGGFHMNFKNSESMLINRITKKANVDKYLNVFTSENIVFTPMLYSIRGMGYVNYINFPHPVIWRGSDDLVNDPYNLRHKFKLQRDVSNSDGKNILFDRQIKIEKKVFLASDSWNDSFFFLSSSDDSLKIELIYESIKYRKYTYDIFPKSKDTYYMLRYRRIYAIRWKDGKSSITIYPIY